MKNTFSLGDTILGVFVMVLVALCWWLVAPIASFIDLRFAESEGDDGKVDIDLIRRIFKAVCLLSAFGLVLFSTAFVARMQSESLAFWIMGAAYAVTGLCTIGLALAMESIDQEKELGENLNESFWNGLIRALWPVMAIYALVFLRASPLSLEARKQIAFGYLAILLSGYFGFILIHVLEDLGMHKLFMATLVFVWIIETVLMHQVLAKEDEVRRRRQFVPA